MKKDVKKIYEEGAKWWLERIKEKTEIEIAQKIPIKN